MTVVTDIYHQCTDLSTAIGEEGAQYFGYKYAVNVFSLGYL